MARIKIINFGCSSNVAESEMIAGLIKKSNHEIVENNAEIAIVNACSVKGHSVSKWLKEANNNSNVIVTGCIIPYSKNILKEMNASIVSTHNISQITDAIDHVLDGNRVEITDQKKSNKASLPKIRRNPLIEIIPVCNGCQFNCTYCATKLIKGDLYSYPEEDILNRARQAISEGCKEIWLTSQDTGAYGLDIGTTFPNLLRKILSLEGDFKVRVGMTNPNHVYRDLKELIELYKHPKMFKFLHVPVQSGSDKILKLMKRPHNSNHYYRVVEEFRKEIPGITIATDIIVCFPEETDDDFNHTLDLLKISNPEVLNMSKYWKMEGTKAAAMKQVVGDIRRDRSKICMELFGLIAMEKNKKLINTEFEIMINEKSKNDTWVGRNDSYRSIILSGNHFLGEIVRVRITDATSIDFRAVSL